MRNKLSIFLFVFMAAIAAFAATGCVSSTPVPQYSESVSFAVVYTHDNRAELSSKAVDESVVAALNSSLTERSLSVNPVTFSAVSEQMNAVRDTDRRIQSLKSVAQGSQIILLGEFSTEFYAALSGRYRWDIDVNLTIYDLVTRNTLSDKFSVPAALMYAHENGDDAISAVQADIQKHIGSLVDAFMKGRTIRNDMDVRPERPARSAAPAVSTPEPAPMTPVAPMTPAENVSDTSTAVSSESATVSE